MSMAATGLLQDQIQGLEQDVAAGAGLASAGDRLGDGGADVARDAGRRDLGPTAKPGPRRKRIQPGGGSLDENAAGDAGRVEVADGEDRPALWWDREANIFQRMIRAQASAKALETTKPKQGSGAKFQEYISHDTVAHEAKRVLPQHGVLFQPLIKTFTQNGNRTEVVMTGKFTNVDNPAEYLEYEGIGYGVDSSDKGPGIAMSYAKKMVISQALLLNTKEDIEEHSNEFKPEADSVAVREAEATTEVVIKAWADSYREALRGAKTLADLKRIRAENVSMMQKVPEATRSYFVDMITELESTLS